MRQLNNMSEYSELDKIIKGKATNSIAMAVFAVEMKSMQRDLAEVKTIVQSDSGKFLTKEEGATILSRIIRLENAALKVLAVTFIIVLSAVIGIAIKGN